MFLPLELSRALPSTQLQLHSNPLTSAVSRVPLTPQLPRRSCPSAIILDTFAVTRHPPVPQHSSLPISMAELIALAELLPFRSQHFRLRATV